LSQWIDLCRLHRLHADLARGALQACRTGRRFAFQKVSPLIFSQLISDAAQILSLVTDSQSRKMLNPGVNKPARKSQSAKQQKTQTQQRVLIPLAGYRRVSLSRGNSSDHLLMDLSIRHCR
jgi:hypothetical protein